MASETMDWFLFILIRFCFLKIVSIILVWLLFECFGFWKHFDLWDDEVRCPEAGRVAFLAHTGATVFFTHQHSVFYWGLCVHMAAGWYDEV